MNILLWILGVLVFLAVSYFVLLLFVFSNAEKPQDCACGGEKSLEYLGFFSQPPGNSSSKYIPRAYYRCSQCGVAMKLERGEWYEVDGKEAQEAVDSLGES